MKQWGAFLIPCLVLAAFFFSACGGGGSKGLTLDGYFQRIVKIDQDHEASAQPLRDEVDAAATDLQDTDPVPAGFKQTLINLFDNEDDFVTALDEVHPPQDAKAAHEEAIAALKAEVTQGRSVTDGMSSATTMGDLNSAFASEAASKLEERRTNACLALQKLAQDNGISADLTC